MPCFFFKQVWQDFLKFPGDLYQSAQHVQTNLVFKQMLLHQPDVLEPNVRPQAAPDDHAEQHHNLFPPGFLLVLKSFLGVICSSCSVLHSTLYMSINPEKKILQIDISSSFNSSCLLTISPWFSMRTDMSMNISCSSLIDCSNLMNISCLKILSCLLFCKN